MSEINKMGTVIYIPKLGANISSVEIGEIRVKEGDLVNKGDILFEIITDKATFEVEAEGTGKLLKFILQVGDNLQVLDEVGFIGEDSENVPTLKKGTVEEEITTEVIIKKESSNEKKIKATPAAKKLARDKNLDLNFTFNDSEKVIREQDILDYLESINNTKDNLIIAKLGFRKRQEIKSLQSSKDYIYSSVTVAVSLSNINEKKELIEKKENVRISLGQYIMYYVAKVLEKFPTLNAFYKDNEIKLYKEINLGFAVSFKNDLVVPIIKHANQLNLYDFLSKYNELTLKIIRNEILAEELSNGTFTITDLSSSNVLNFSPVINANQAAILGISSPYDSCKLKEAGNFVYEQKCNLTLAFDHRVSNGMEVANFLESLKSFLE
jgi:pyruvate dehydrogenase E2 component (dihydrolipoamide acetyltransferase)